MASIVAELADFMNVVLGVSERSTTMWEKLPRDVALKFQDGARAQPLRSFAVLVYTQFVHVSINIHAKAHEAT